MYLCLIGRRIGERNIRWGGLTSRDSPRVVSPMIPPPRSPTISTTLILCDSKMESPIQKWIQPCLPIVSVAAKALADKNIPVVEFGQQVKWRHGDPVVLSVSNKAF